MILDWRLLGYEKDDPWTVCFGYPKSFQAGSILPVVRLEIGALAAWMPAKQVEIANYAAQQYPQVFHLSSP